MRIGREILGDYREGSSREWIITNGLGGYASSTAIGVNTRRYHGLLVAPEEPPWGRMLLLSKLEEEILLGETSLRFSANKYPGVVHPRGYEHLEEFSLDPHPSFTYTAGVRLKKTIFMPRGWNAVVVSYEVLELPEQCFMRIYPLINHRGIHEVAKERHGIYTQSSGKKGAEISKQPNGIILRMGSDLMRYIPSDLPEDRRWYRNMEYEREAERGYEYLEDHYCPGHFELELEEGLTVHVVATGGSNGREAFEEFYSEDPARLQKAMAKEEARAKALTGAFHGGPRYLALAADSFLVKMGGEMGIIAGYHWFTTWGRDAMVALPGLCLATQRFEEARRVLRSYAAHCRDGLIPNFIGREGASYNSADTSLWFVYALHKYLAYTDDVEFASKLWPKLEEIVQWYTIGTGGGLIRCEGDGLLSIGTKETQLTWMDAKVEGWPVTPRHGKAVEINALWYNALRMCWKIADRLGFDPSRYAGLASRVREGFASFWNPEKSCLYDVLRAGEKDASVRPNQIFALSLPFPLLGIQKAKTVLAKIEEELLTPYGLRSLSPREAGYFGTCEGDQTRRDSAYHQGTVWSWLMGSYITALVRYGGGSARDKARGLLGALLGDHLYVAGLGTVSEVFDGDAPHTPRGCISQAWSVGELLRCYIEDVEGKRPAHEAKWSRE